MQLVRAVADQGLVEVYRLMVFMVFPTVLGRGKRLFGEADEAADLRLTESKPAGETPIPIYEPTPKG